MDYGRAIRTCRVAFGLQQKELARLSGLTSSHLSLIEAGKRQPSTASIEKICDALGVPMHLLMLLAADPGDLNERPRSEVDKLARSLLDILVSAPEFEEA